LFGNNEFFYDKHNDELPGSASGPAGAERQNVFDTIDEIPYDLLFYKHYTGTVR